MAEFAEDEKITILLSERFNIVKLTDSEKAWLEEKGREAKDFYFKGTIKEIKIDEETDNHFKGAFDLAVIGQRVLRKKWPYMRTGSVILILTNQPNFHQHKLINENVFQGNDFFFAPDSDPEISNPLADSEMKSWIDFNAVKKQIDDREGTLPVVLDIMKQVTADPTESRPSYYYRPLRTMMGEDAEINKDYVNETVNNLLNNNVNSIHVELEDAPVVTVWQLNEPLTNDISQKYTIKDPAGNVINLMTLDEIRNAIFGENIIVTDMAGEAIRFGPDNVAGALKSKGIRKSIRKTKGKSKTKGIRKSVKKGKTKSKRKGKGKGKAKSKKAKKLKIKKI